MPTGVYFRSPELIEEIKKNLAMGRSPVVRAKVREILKQNAQNPAWCDMVSAKTCKAMHQPQIRSKHLKGLGRARQEYGNMFKGGNGAPMTPMVREFALLLEPLGFQREYVIRTRGHRTQDKPPTYYKADFAHPQWRMVIELDGKMHLSKGAKVTDAKKDRVLNALGWEVRRISC